jgi:hypothetical protein
MHGPEEGLIHVPHITDAGATAMLVPHGEITAEMKNAKPKKVVPEAQPPSTHISVRESANAATILK